MVQFLLNKVSGFGWDEDRKVVKAEDDVWDTFIEVRRVMLMAAPHLMAGRANSRTQSSRSGAPGPSLSITASVHW